MCVVYEALGGGYLTATDITRNVDLISTPFSKREKTKTICYRFDDAAPAHCKALGLCAHDPLRVHSRVIRYNEISVDFDDWYDPVPSGGSSSMTSKIESYQLTVNEVIPSTGNLKVDTKIVMTKLVNPTATSAALHLPVANPILLAVVLEVKDAAKNVKQARRFVLFDNSSCIQVDDSKSVIVHSASRQTNFTWQTHHNEICLDWKGRFFNQFYQDNQLLNPIEPDTNVSGVYDQIDGILPISGTEKVHGIIKYTYFWRLNNGNFSRGTDIPNIKNQSYCKHFDLRDGQTFTFKVVATDIANNTCEDSTFVNIDRTVPHINNMWLQNGDNKRLKSLYVNASEELSTMNLYFEALDPHSGLLNVSWEFGTCDSWEELLNGVLRPVITNNVSMNLLNANSNR